MASLTSQPQLSQQDHFFVASLTCYTQSRNLIILFAVRRMSSLTFKHGIRFLVNITASPIFALSGTISSDTINLASDASDMGFGACYGSQWIQAAYPAGWKKFHIGVKEIYPVYVLICMFGHLMKNNNIALLCDNSGDVDIINKQSSKCKQTMQIMRPLTLKLVEFNIHLIAKHIPGHTNVIPDRISRFQITKQLLKHHHMNETPTAIPEHLLPGNFNIS